MKSKLTSLLKKVVPVKKPGWFKLSNFLWVVGPVTLIVFFVMLKNKDKQRQKVEHNVIEVKKNLQTEGYHLTEQCYYSSYEEAMAGGANLINTVGHDILFDFSVNIGIANKYGEKLGNMGPDYPPLDIGNTQANTHLYIWVLQPKKAKNKLDPNKTNSLCEYSVWVKPKKIIR